MKKSLELDQFANICGDSAAFYSKMFFYKKENAKVVKTDRRNISYMELFQAVDTAVNSGQMSSLEMMYTHFLDIKKDETISNELKFDLVMGELELLINATTNYFFKKYDPKGRIVKHSQLTIQGLKEKYGNS